MAWSATPASWHPPTPRNVSAFILPSELYCFYTVSLITRGGRRKPVPAPGQMNYSEGKTRNAPWTGQLGAGP